MDDLQISLYDAENCATTTIPFIPFDLIVEILSFLPAKSLFRFQYVSKLWFSTIRSKTFIDLFLTRSKTRPRLLFTFDRIYSQKNFIFSAPEDNDDKSSNVMARYDMTILDPDCNRSCGSVNGFVCYIGSLANTITVCNPTTRQIVKLPKPERVIVFAGLGYDPVEDQYKVLSVMLSRSEDTQLEYFVCTLSSSQKQEWRKIENPTGDTYNHFYAQTCIDGVLYYGVGNSRIVMFDVKSEKIDFIITPKKSSIDTSSIYQSTLINYKGKLGGVDYCTSQNLNILWVLEDAEKWSSMTFALPKREDLIGDRAASEGVIHTGELMVFHPWIEMKDGESSEPLYVCYYDFNKKSVRKVEIIGMEDGDPTLTDGEMTCRPGHIENIRFL